MPRKSTNPCGVTLRVTASWAGNAHRGQRMQRLGVGARRRWCAGNARLKKLLAEAELDKAMLKELAEGNF
jgi:hypothetical protein